MIEVFGIEIAQQSLLVGAVTGLTYAVFAAGFVLIYRSTGVLNFAQGEIGVFGVALMALLTTQYSIPYWFALVLSVAACALIGSVIELTVVRRLFNAPRLVLLIATLGVGQLLLFATMNLPEVSSSGPFPLPFTITWEITDDLTILSRELQVLIVVPILIVALAVFMTRTKFGLAVRASASNPDTARVYGISVKRTSTIVWTIAGAFAAVTAILIAPLNGVTAAQAGTSAMAAPLLLRALTVALIARMRSLPMVLVGGVIVGIVETIVRRNVTSTDRNIVDVYFFVAILVLVLFTARGRRDDANWSLSPRVKPIPERLRSLWYVRHMPHMGFAVIFGFLALLPVFIDRPSQLFLWTSIVLYAVVTLSITMLTGWAGQLSLGQFAFVGLGGLTTVALRNGHDIPVPFDLWDMSFELPWGAAIAIGTLAGVLAAFVIGLPALRVQGLFLAVTTLAFAVAAANWLLRQDVFLDGRSTTPSLPKPSFAGIDFSSRKSFYLLCLVVLVLAALMVARLRRTGIGRTFIAVRDNPDMAAASTVSPNRMKLSAFALAGGMAALAGGLYVTLLNTVTPDVIFNPGESIRIVAIAIIGGLGSVAGPIIGALYVLGLPTVLGDTDEVKLLTSSIGLLILLLYFPGGLMQIAYSVRDALLGFIDRRLDERGVPHPVPAIAKRVPSRHERAPVPVGPDEPWLSVRDLTVRFGGNRAVHAVDLDVYAGEIVGLIGANGAGKSTLMNAISGFVPSTGAVHVLGRDLSGVPAHRRHQRGLGRGFQAARLYPDLTVRETFMVALEARERSMLLPSMTGLPPSPRAERRKRSEASELIDFLGLGRYADEFIAYLSTGTRRIVELGSLLAVDARILLLDEPTGGVAQRETEAFGPLIMRVQRELDAAVLVIEHDMPLVMSISDRIYCLETGEVIAEGTPEAVRNNPLVIASYLGTDERAIQRSGATGVVATSGG
ncbi:MAG TPA: ATP-binding cassette domain-containing protein [Acidimicrobiales bacterium]